MKGFLDSFPWHRTATTGAGLAIAIATLGMASFPAPAQTLYPDADTLAYNLLELQQSNQRWIQIDLTRQRLIAWEGPQEVYAVVISTGKETTPTPTGLFAIQTKHEIARMQGPGYDVPDVPFTMYYYRGYAIHGAYWHNNFGTPVSHGCTNVAVNHAEWLFDWADVGTPVVVHY